MFIVHGLVHEHISWGNSLLRWVTACVSAAEKTVSNTHDALTQNCVIHSVYASCSDDDSHTLFVWNHGHAIKTFLILHVNAQRLLMYERGKKWQWDRKFSKDKSRAWKRRRETDIYLRVTLRHTRSVSYSMDNIKRMSAFDRLEIGSRRTHTYTRDKFKRDCQTSTSSFHQGNYTQNLSLPLYTFTKIRVRSLTHTFFF